MSSGSDAAGFVLAGGQSSRMGRDKALVPFVGKPLVAHALYVLEQADLPAAIAGASPTNRASFESFAQVVDDPEPGLGPLAGICASLASTPARYAVFLPVDLPLLPVSLIVYLLYRARTTGSAITVASIAGIPQTFPAVVNRAALPAMQAVLQSRTGGCFSAFQSAAAILGQPVGAVAVELLVQSGHVAHPLGLPPLRWFLNLNTPEDLERAEALSARIA